MTQPNFRLRPEHQTPTEIIGRRKFVGWIGGVLALSACGKSPQAILGPTTSRFDIGGPFTDASSNSAVLSVKEFGAVGDGLTDDTAALNRAIAALGPVGGTVFVPNGIYLVDPSKSVRLTDNVTLHLDVDATLMAIPVSVGSSSVINAIGVKNVKVLGGKIVGERIGHRGTTGEWGMGIKILGCSNVRIQGVQVLDCWGDGIYVGANGVGKECQDVTINQCIARNNRRQGLSITGCLGALVYDSEFTDTNGTAPASGIDLEPNASLRVDQVVIRNCLTARNAGYGILLCGRGVTNTRIESNRLTDNGLAGLALIRYTNQAQAIDNTIERNRENGVLFDEGANLNELLVNTIQQNSVGRYGTHSNVLLQGGSSQNRLIGNRFGSVRRLLPNTLPNIVVGADCVDNLIESLRPSPSGQLPQPSGGAQRSR